MTQVAEVEGSKYRDVTKSQVLSMILCRLAKLVLHLGSSLAFDDRTEGGLFPVGLNCAHCFV